MGVYKIFTCFIKPIKLLTIKVSMKKVLTLFFETIMVLLSFTVTGQKDCSKPLTGWTPLIDFETGQSFMGFSGG